MTNKSNQNEIIKYRNDDPIKEIHGKRPTLHLSNSEITERYLRIEGDWFSFDGREYLKSIYNLDASRMIIKASRQVEKTEQRNTRVLLDNGWKEIKDVEIGDKLISAEDDANVGTGKITWKSEEYTKPCYKIETELGHKLIAGEEHPIRQWGRWTDAKNLNEGDIIATVCDYPNNKKAEKFDDDIIKYVGWMLAEGSMTDDNFDFNQNINSSLYDEFINLCEKRNWYYNCKPDHKNPENIQIGLSREDKTYSILKELNLWGKKSETKIIPKEFMNLNKRQTRILIESMWAGDGSLKSRNTSSTIDLVYCTISEHMAKQMQALMWQFGIPTRIRENKPKAYKGTDKMAYLVTVRSRRGYEKFFNEFEITGRPNLEEEMAKKSNDNRDILPKKIEDTIKKIKGTHDNPSKPGESLYSDGLQTTLSYNLSRKKLGEYIDHFRSRDGYNQNMVNDLEEHADSDIFWDKVKNIEYVGEKPCYDITVEPNNNFISEGIITHNSTTVSNMKIIENMTNDHYSSLFVSPTMQQTQRFSNDRLERRIKESEYINRFFYEPAERKNVYEKHFANGSVMWLSYARNDADRIRGISADRVFLDEIQDIQKDVIPVIEECMSHAPNPRSMYTGTPKTKQNTIEKYWDMSTQCEWVVYCEGCGKYNVLGLRNVGIDGPVCANCDKRIHPAEQGQWQYMKDPENASMWGFRVTQLMVPWIVESKNKWQNLVDKIENQYTNKEIYNEVLGLPYSTAAHPIKKEDLKKASGNYDVYENQNGHPKREYFTGIDIGSGDSGELGDDATSYTAIAILRREQADNFKIVYLKKYTGVEADPEFALKDMKKHISRFNCEKIGIDWGLSQHERNDLRKTFGYNKVVPVWYSNISGIWKWDENNLKFNVNRTETLTELFQGIKEGSVTLPKYEKNKDTLDDFLSVFNETGRRGQLIYDHEDEDPDDIVHAINYARIVAKTYYGLTRYEVKEADIIGD